MFNPVQWVSYKRRRIDSTIDWWLADELVRAMRSDSAFSQWLHAEQLEGRWTKGQRAQVAEAAKALGRGVRELMQAFAMGAGASVTNG